jgi:hypothetical protein
VIEVFWKNLRKCGPYALNFQDAPKILKEIKKHCGLCPNFLNVKKKF